MLTKLKDALDCLSSLLFPDDTELLKNLEKLRPEPHIKKLANDKIIYIFDYRNKHARRAILKVKSYGAREFAIFFSNALCDLVLDIISENQIWNKEKIIITPVPLHKSKLKKRGFNQNELLLEKCKKNPETMNISYRNDILYRKKKTKEQKNLNKKERFENMRDAFTCKNISRNENALVVIVDDISTSGASLLSAKQSLKKACPSCKFLLVAVLGSEL